MELALLILPPDRSSGSLSMLENMVGACDSFLIVRGGKVLFVHPSAKEYIRDQARLKIFPLGLGHVHEILHSKSLEAMSTTLRRNIYGLDHLGVRIGEIRTPDPNPLEALRYSCTHWADHFCDGHSGDHSEQRNNHKLNKVHAFLSESSLFWLEALSLLRGISEGLCSIWRLEKFLRVSDKGREIGKSQKSRVKG
jgi:hypothetical protein